MRKKFYILDFEVEKDKGRRARSHHRLSRRMTMMRTMMGKRMMIYWMTSTTRMIAVTLVRTKTKLLEGNMI
jgi:hypothetical protein